MFRVKICGLTRAEDIRAAVKAGADALGFQMSRGPRKISPAKAKALVRQVPPTVTPVGVFVNEPLSRVKRLAEACGFQAVQLHGDEGAHYAQRLGLPVLKAVPMKGRNSYKPFRAFRVAAFLLDSYNEKVRGGSGRGFDPSWAREAVRGLPGPVLLAGGLNPSNVRRAVRSSRVFGVDVSSGVEAGPGLKDPRKVSLFVRRAKKAFLSSPLK